MLVSSVPVPLLHLFIANLFAARPLSSKIEDLEECPENQEEKVPPHHEDNRTTPN